MEYLQVAGGLILLVFAGDFLVRGAVTLAHRHNMPPLIIGITIVAFGTSAPELVVSIDAVLAGVPTLALGNVVGSNIANVFLVVGLPAIIAPMTCSAPRLTRSMLIMLAVTGVFIYLAYQGGFGWQQGLILLAMLTAFLTYSVVRGRHHPEEEAEFLAEIEEVEAETKGGLIAMMLIVGGLSGLAFGAHILILGSVQVATTLGVSEAVIGLTLVALGTSLPELFTALIAAVRGHCDVAVGNVIGSNIFNLLAIVGIASLFGEIPVPEAFLEFDLWVMLAASLALLPFAVARLPIGRIGGVGLFAAYVLYIYLLTQGASAMSPAEMMP